MILRFCCCHQVCRSCSLLWKENLSYSQPDIRGEPSMLYPEHTRQHQVSPAPFHSLRQSDSIFELRQSFCLPFFSFWAKKITTSYVLELTSNAWFQKRSCERERLLVEGGSRRFLQKSFFCAPFHKRQQQKEKKEKKTVKIILHFWFS